MYTYHIIYSLYASFMRMTEPHSLFAVPLCVLFHPSTQPALPIAKPPAKRGLGRSRTVPSMCPAGSGIVMGASPAVLLRVAMPGETRGSKLMESQERC